MNASDSATKRRKPSDAASLSVMLAGLGHIYCGQFRMGMLWMGASTGLLIAAMIALLFNQGPSGIWIALALVGIGLGVSIASAVQSWRLAKREGKAFELREYNRWYVYLILLLACSFGTAVGLAYVLKARVVEAFVIPTRSMEPTITSGDRIVALKQVFLDRDPERGELVVFRNLDKRRQHWIKRVIGVAGDRVSWLADGGVEVNGVELALQPTENPNEFVETNGSRDYRIRITNNVKAEVMREVTVPDHHCFVMGDNRPLSKDSRHFGTIPYAGLVADPVAKIWGGFGKLE